MTKREAFFKDGFLSQKMHKKMTRRIFRRVISFPTQRSVAQAILPVPFPAAVTDH